MINKKFKAFTIVEVLVALWIITVAVLGPLSSAINSSATTRDSKSIVIAAYLAQESFELLRYYRDTLFLRCISNDPSCIAIPLPTPATDNEQGFETAWRQFKETLSNGGSTESCFVSENPTGCTYDVESFLSNPLAGPVILNADNALCQNLNRDDRKQKGLIASSTTDGMYLCDDKGGDLKPTSFKRVIKVTSIPSVVPSVPGSYDELYNDDLRIEVEVSYSRSNGIIKKTKSVDFIRART
jgi:hypothetical protein